MRRTPQTIAHYLSRHGFSTPSPSRDRTTAAKFEAIYIAGGKKYTLKCIVAKGGMGVIYEAEDVDCRRTVALKVLPRKLAVPTKDVLRFIAEAQITSQLEHPNIVPIHELGMDTRHRVFYTMKYIRGRTLASILIDIRKGKHEIVEQFPLSRLLNIFQKVCDAVAFAHARRVIHRDIKPDNVMVGDYGEVVLMDWGLALHVGDNKSVSSAPFSHETLGGVSTIRDDAAREVLKTLSGQIMGSPGFMAPEQINDENAVGYRSDIYGLGAILYSMLTLRPTVSGKQIVPVLKRIVIGDFPSPSFFNDPRHRPADQFPAAGEPAFPHCPDGIIPPILSDIAMQALATDPEDRYPSVKDVQQEIETYQSGLVWTPVVDEDFSRPDIESRWDIMGGTWSIQDGELVIHGGEPQLIILKKPVPGDVRIEFECRQNSIYLNDVSCFINAMPARDPKDTAFTGYEFKYGGFENSLIMLIRNDVRLWTQGGSPIERGKRYRVLAERIGNRLRMVVNDREIFKIIDPKPISGPERTAAGLYGWRATTHYSRVRVYSLQAPWRSDLLDFADRQIQKGNLTVADSLYKEVLETAPDTARRQHAQSGLEVTRRYRTIQRELPAIRARLENAWPGQNVQLSMDHDGLAVDISGCGVTDLEPLRGLPLRSLNCQYNCICSLDPLRGGKLVTLNCSGNPIQSLEPLRGMSLTQIVCECCRIESLDPLRDMPLQLLSAGDNPLMSLEALRGLSLTNLYVWGTGIESLEPLRGMALATLDCYANRLSSLAPLAGMPLATLNCESNRIESLDPIRGAPLRVLHCGQNRIKDLEPLRGEHLFHLTCACNLIKDLTPLQGLPLGRLICGHNRLISLDPFAEEPPELFQYECETLPNEEIERARAIWAKRAERAHLVREADILLALRKNRPEQLYRMAVRSDRHAYLYVPKLMTWEEAMFFCEKLGGHLVVIRSQEEHDFLFSAYPAAWTWMGLQTTPRGLEWVTGEPVTYTRFAFRRDEIAAGPKVFARLWSYQSQPGYENPFIIEWDLPEVETIRIPPHK